MNVTRVKSCLPKQVFLSAILGLLASAAIAQQPWSITVKPGSAFESTLSKDKVNIIEGAQQTVTVTCADGVDCTQVKLNLAGLDGTVINSLSPAQAGSKPLTFTINSNIVKSTGMLLQLALGKQPVTSFLIGSLPSNPAREAKTTSGDAGSGVLAQLLTAACEPRSFGVNYNRKDNSGAIVVTPTGDVLARGLDTFDEDDTLEVTIYANVELLPLLKVERTSAFRDRGIVRLVGGNESVPEIARQAKGCDVRTFKLTDFAPGRAQVQIEVQQGTQTVPVGSFDFNVNPLYSGMLTLGAVWSNVVDPGFKLVSNGTTTVIAPGAEGKRDLLYTLFYTPFVWGKRDLEKSVPWYQYFNPSIGVVPAHIGDNAMVGISLDLPMGFVITAGRHYRKITVLSGAAGLKAGAPFTGTVDQLPTAKSWENDNFYAVTIDLRAMVQVLRVAAGTTSAPAK